MDFQHHTTILPQLMKQNSATRKSAVSYLKAKHENELKRALTVKTSMQQQQQQTAQQLTQESLRSLSLPASNTKESPTNSLIAQKFLVGHKIGNGNFGEIRRGQNTENKEVIAIKFENRTAQTKLLAKEFNFYKTLGTFPGIPATYFYGQTGGNNALVMELLGESLEDLFDICGRKFSEKTVCMIAIQILRIMQYVHSKNLIYRDIKPENFLIGHSHDPAKHRLVHIIDFGLAKEYIDPETNKHIPYRENKNLTGTARYMSINTHLGREQSRRDDLEAIGHMLCYFLRGSLPWQGIKEEVVKVKYQKIGETKQKTALSELTAGFPKEFHDYLEYARGLKFLEQPNYDMLIKKFERLMTERNWWRYDSDGEVVWDYDWVEKLRTKRSAKPTRETLQKTYERVVQNYNRSNIGSANNRGKISLLNDTKTSKATNANTNNTNTNNNNNNNNSSINFNNNTILNNTTKPIIDASLLRREPTFCKILKEKLRSKFTPNIYNKYLKGADNTITTTVIKQSILSKTPNEHLQQQQRISTISSHAYIPPTSATVPRMINHHYRLDGKQLLQKKSSTIAAAQQQQRISAFISASNEKFNYHSSPNFCYNFCFRDNNTSNSLYGNFDKCKNT